MSPVPRLLFIEDDDAIRLALRLFLEDEGYEVIEAATGEEGLRRFQLEQYDLVLVDLRLPGMHGFEVVRAIRHDSTVPILIVTAQTDTHDVVGGLEAGADDYITKPVVPKELAARIRASLRRSQAPVTESPSGMVVGAVEIRPSAGEVLKDGHPVSLTKTEFKLLCELAQNPGRLLTRDVLLERVWGYGYFGDGRLVDVHVRRLRTKVEADAANPRHVVTVRGLGYRLQT
jgi:DNA-binding response OmpR family regulator